VAKLSKVLDQIFQVAVERDGYFAVSDVRTQGVVDAELYRLLARGDIERVNRGVYRIVRFPKSANGELWAALLWAQPAVLSHITALRLHRLIEDGAPFIDITVPSDSRLRKEAPPLYHLRSADVPEGDRDTIDRLSVTNLRRSILDVFVDGTIERGRLRAAVKTALGDGRLDASTADQLFALLGSADLFLEAARLHAERERSQKNERQTPHLLPVRVVAPERIAVAAPEGSGIVPAFASHALDVEHPAIDRAMVLVHGALRDADQYYQLGEAVLADARVAANTALIVPQFLAEQDVRYHGLPNETLSWETWQWMGGAAAVRTEGISSFRVLDAILEKLANRTAFPALREVIVVGHSAGGQFVHRYAILADVSRLRGAGVSVKFVVANASSYTYFDKTRPTADGQLAAFDQKKCPDFNRWKYGLEDAPPYGAGRSREKIEREYVARNVTYLLGTEDNDTAHPALDRSCQAMAQGPHRYARGHAYFRYLAQRHLDKLKHRIIDVPGVGHDSSGMLTSAEAIEALFGRRARRRAPNLEPEAETA
jgi:pimeloyl-ACP methyl ester carboxylesterase